VPQMTRLFGTMSLILPSSDLSPFFIRSCATRVDEPLLSGMEKTSICAGLVPSHLLKQERWKPEAHSNQQSRSDEEG
jgi:hypothetical protein